MQDLIGKKFGRLKVISVFLKPPKRIYLKCKCDCGNIKSFYKSSLILGYTKSCGCLHSELASKRMNKKNPMWMPGIREKVIATNRLLGTRPIIRGGNGKEMPLPQKLLLTGLGKGWVGEYPVPTKKKRNSGYPTCYKIDIANYKLKIGIEVNGGSHGSLSRQKQDKKKIKLLENLGWKIFSYKNKEVMKNLEEIINKFI